MFIKLKHDPFLDGDKLRPTFVGRCLESVGQYLKHSEHDGHYQFIVSPPPFRLKLDQFSRPQRSSIIVGCQMCTREAGELPRSGQDGSRVYQRDGRWFK